MNIFISHASEEKELIVKPLMHELYSRGYENIWYDESSLHVGDSLFKHIYENINICDFAIVVLSSHYLKKDWPRNEFMALERKEALQNRKVILPVLHDLDIVDFGIVQSILKERFLVKWSLGVKRVVDSIDRAIKGNRRGRVCDISKW